MIFVTLCQTYMDKMMGDPASELFHVMLKLLNYPRGSNFEVCQFWKALYGQLHRVDKPEERSAKIAQFVDISHQVLLICVERMQLSDEVYTALNGARETDEEF